MESKQMGGVWNEGNCIEVECKVRLMARPKMNAQTYQVYDQPSSSGHTVTAISATHPELQYGLMAFRLVVSSFGNYYMWRNTGLHLSGILCLPKGKGSGICPPRSVEYPNDEVYMEGRCVQGAPRVRKDVKKVQRVHIYWWWLRATPRLTKNVIE